MATSTSLTTALTDVPAILKPYLTDWDEAKQSGGILPAAQRLLAKDYATTYGTPLEQAGLAGAGRIAGLSPMQTQVGTALQGMQAPSQFGQGTAAAQSGLGSLGQAADAFGNISNVNAPSLNQYQMAGPQNVTADNLSMYQMAPTQNFGAEQAAQYMSPYQQNVVDYAKDQALRDAQMRSVAQNLGSARQGTYGGARSLLAQTELDRNLQSQMQGLQYKGSQDAYTQAQQQFERDRAAGMTTSQANLAAALGVQQLGSTQSLQAQQANQAAQQAAQQANLQAQLGVQQLGAGQSMEAQRANQAAELQAAQGYGALGQTYGSLGSTLGALGTAQQASNLDLIKTQGAYGDLQRGVQQQQLDSQYQDLMNKLNYPISNLETMNNLVRGAPLTQTSTSTTSSTPSPSFASQLAGTGLTGLSLYNMFAGK